MIINTLEQYNELVTRMNRELHVCTPIFRDIYLHPAANEIYCVGYSFIDGDIYTVSITSKDAPIFPMPVATNHTFTTESTVGGYDVLLLAHLRNEPIPDIKTFYSSTIHATYAYFQAVKHMHRLVPITVWVDVMRAYHRSLVALVEKYHGDVHTSTYKGLHRAYTTLRQIEKSGVYVDIPRLITYFGEGATRAVRDNLLYTQYNPYTTTGRPSNRYNGINFAALPKHDTSRAMMTSRFPGGILLQFDFDAYHLRLVGNHANLQLPTTPLHEYLGQLLFEKTTLTPEEYDLAKQHTFHVLYGDNVDTDVPVLQEIKAVADSVYASYITQGFIKTPLFGRQIHLSDTVIPKHKVFNYFVQALEFEYTSTLLDEVVTYLTTKLSKCILYTYDAILLDVAPDEYTTVRQGITRILEKDGFPVKVYTGLTYHDMEKVL